MSCLVVIAEIIQGEPITNTPVPTSPPSLRDNNNNSKSFIHQIYGLIAIVVIGFISLSALCAVFFMKSGYNFDNKVCCILN